MTTALNDFATNNFLLYSALSIPGWAALHVSATLAATHTQHCGRRHYSQLTSARQAEWANKVVSSLHAVFMVCAACTYLAVTPRPWATGPTEGQSPALDYLWGASLGYTCYDLLHWLQYRKHYGNEILAHHVVMWGACYYEGTYHYKTYLASLLAVSECSTPLLNIRWFLRSCGVEKGPAVTYNGAALVLAFFFGRVCTTTDALLLQLSTLWNWLDDMTWGQRILPTFFIGSFVCLNLYWFRIIAGKAWKVLVKGKADDEPDRRRDSDDATEGAVRSRSPMSGGGPRLRSPSNEERQLLASNMA